MDHSLKGSGSIAFGMAQIQYRFVNKVEPYLIVSFNPAKVVHGHNLHLLEPRIDKEIIASAINRISEFLGLSRLTDPRNWNLIQLELSQNRFPPDPKALVFGYARIAHLQKKSQVFTRHGTHTVTFGPRCNQLKLYAKGPEFNRKYGRQFPELIEEAISIIRFELVSNKSGITKMMGERNLASFLRFLDSDRPKEVLESSWNKLPQPTQPKIAELADALLLDQSTTQTRAILAYSELSEEIGAKCAATKLGLSRGTEYNYRKSLEQAQKLIAGGEVN